MMLVAGIKKSGNEPIVLFDSNNNCLEKDLDVIIECDDSVEFGKVIFVKEISDCVLPKVIRIANKRDKKRFEENTKLEMNALKKCHKLIDLSKLEMHVISAHYNYERSQVIFKFTADERIDFRKLARDLGSMLKVRVELRQIGIRDKAKEVGGIGICGRKLCCSNAVCNFDTISISLAKNQSLSLNPTKINGCCGRLLCCLKYENDNYPLDGQESKNDCQK